MTRKIIHVDMDAFFASVEQRDDPALRGRPVAVGHGGGRGVVAAASYEARRFGVRSAMPSALALRRCPELVFVRPRFDVYRAVSQQIRAIFLDYTPLVEPLSLDEAYLDVTANLRRLPSATATAQEIRSRIADETALTASAGISYNKLLAKLASDRHKPDGQCVVPPAAAAAFVAMLDVGQFHGIGPKTAARLRAMGLNTGADLRRCEPALLEARFGKAGVWFHRIAHGEDDRPVAPDRPRKSSGSEKTFSQDLATPDGVEAAVRRMAGEVWEWCDRSRRHGRAVTVKVRYADFRQVTRARTLQRIVTDAAMLTDTALALVRSLFPLAAPVRLVGVTVSGFAKCFETAAEPELDLAPRQTSFLLDEVAQPLPRVAALG